MQSQEREKGWGPVIVSEPGSHAGDIARLVARNLGYEAVIADEMVPRTLGVSFAEVFAAGAEGWYRVKESQLLLTRLLPMKGVVLEVASAALSDPGVQRALDGRCTFWVGARLDVAARSICADSSSREEVAGWLALRRGRVAARFAGVQIDMNVLDRHAAARLVCTGYLASVLHANGPQAPYEARRDAGQKEAW